MLAELRPRNPRSQAFRFLADSTGDGRNGPGFRGWGLLKPNWPLKGTKRMRILIIDDEEMIRTLAVKILEKAGHAVLTAESGREGLELVERNPDMIDVAIIDHTMPGMTGMETIREIRRFSDSLPCILSSGHIISHDTIPEDIRAKTHVLQKPYRPQNLVEKVASVHETA